MATAPTQQMSLFAPEVARAIDHQVEEMERRGAIEVTWSRAQERRIFHMFAGLIAWCFAGPVTTTRIGEGYTDGLVEKHRTDIVLERFIRVKQWIDELKQIEAEARTTREYQDAYARILGLRDRYQGRLTNWEALIILSECSMQAPLHRSAVAEMMRCFAHCYGVEAYVRLLAEQFEPLRLSDLEAARYNCGAVMRKFPPLDDAERRWIADFNARAKALWHITHRRDTAG